jgi:hypothetical protein
MSSMVVSTTMAYLDLQMNMNVINCNLCYQHRDNGDIIGKTNLSNIIGENIAIFWAL